MPNAKKRASKMHDPKQLFILCQYSRESIAEELNTAIEATGSEVEEFTPDDLRLTDEVCQAYVDSVYDAWTNVDETAEAEQQVTIDALEQFEGG
jgi:hypothetical protein